MDNYLDSPELQIPEETPITPEPAPKKRGRPAKNPTDAPIPGVVKPAKTRNKDKDLASGIYTITALLAGLLAHEELKFTTEESELVGNAANRVASYYDLPDMGAAGAWVNLGIVLAVVVTPKIKAIKNLKNKEEQLENVTI